MLTKEELRRQFRILRSHGTEVFPHALNSRLSGLPEIKSASCICCYISYNSEIDTLDFIHWCLTQGKCVVCPRVVGNEIVLHEFHTFSECLANRWGILEPPSSNPQVSPQSIDVYIVPGLAFDLEGYRLGYGQGFYDRLLKNLNSFTIGIGYTDQIVDRLPHFKTDIPLDCLVTDQITLYLSNSKKRRV